MDTTQLVSRVLGVAVMNSGRPVATLFAVQLFVAGVIRLSDSSLPAEVSWAVSPLVLGVCFAAVLAEMLVQHTEGADDVLRNAHVNTLLGAFCGIPAAVLLLTLTTVTDEARQDATSALVARGLTEDQAVLVVDRAAAQLVSRLEAGEDSLSTSLTPSGNSEDMVEALAIIQSRELETGQKFILFGISSGIWFLMTWIRGEVREFVEDLGLEKIWAWFETGGIAVATVLVLLAPIILVVLMALISVLMFAAWALARATMKAWDAANRRACPECESRIRVEAMLCHHCGTAVEPASWLGNQPMDTAAAGSASA